MRRKVQLFFAQFLLIVSVHAQLVGVLQDKTEHPVKGVTVKLILSGVEAISSEDGKFYFRNVLDDDTLHIHHVSFEDIKIAVSQFTGKIQLIPKLNVLEDVEVSTGYYSVTKSKTTGAFTSMDMEHYDKRTNVNIIDRLEGAVPSLQFDRSRQRVGQSETALRVRGVSTLTSDASPLIILDGFPYTQDMNSLNPDDIEDITILRDAASTAIWGARAGNGVIVVNSKKGRGASPSISFRYTFEGTQRPNLLANPNYMTASDMMQVEKMLFDQGFYQMADNIVQPRYVEYLSRHKNGVLSDQELSGLEDGLIQNDIRKEVMESLYRSPNIHNYMLSFQGAPTGIQYYVSANHMDQTSHLQRTGNKRTGIQANLSTALHPKVTVGVLMNYVQNRVENNGMDLTSISPNNKSISPYATLMDADNVPLALEKSYSYDFIQRWNADNLDWSYRPLQELGLNDNTNSTEQMRIRANLDYRLFDNLRLALQYQINTEITDGRNFHSLNSYFTRDLVNRFTQDDGLHVVPLGGILDTYGARSVMQGARAQLDFTQRWQRHEFNMLVGAEATENKYDSNPSARIFDHDPDVLTGSAQLDFLNFYATQPLGFFDRIPGPSSNVRSTLNRFLSYYSNASYRFDDKYHLSASLRWDAANIYGVDFNQKGVPLWSLGGRWDLYKETFWKTNTDYRFSLRGSVGISGNSNNNLSALPQISIGNDSNTGYPRAILTTVGNPNLRWEKVSTYNIGFDVSAWNERLQITFDAYKKSSRDLIGENRFDPTTGIVTINGITQTSNLINYASLDARGFDIELRSLNTTGTFKWNTSLFISSSKNKVREYMSNPSTSLVSYLQAGFAPIAVGESIDQIYKIPFFGLDSQNGFPLTDKGDQDYATFMVEFPLTNLLRIGSAVPLYHGAIMNRFAYKNVSLAVNLTWKAGYFYQRNSIDYYSLFQRGVGHKDFTNRWQRPGDEKNTSIPAMPNDMDAYRDAIYLQSDILMERGDHLRLEDITLAYNYMLPRSRRSIEVFVTGRKLGILWKRGSGTIDPDFPYQDFPIQRSVAIGLNLKL